jgi:uncharacterized protein
LFGSLRKIFHWIFALVLSSMIYALMHFLESARTTDPVTWHAGLVLLPRMLAGVANWHALVPGFINLTLAGTLLGLAYQRTGNLYFSIGLHGGWVFCLKSYGFLCRPVPGANGWWWGTGKMTDGWLALPVLMLTLLLFAKLSGARKTEWHV